MSGATENSSPPVVILGAGAWGTALAVALAPARRVTLWGRNAALMQELAQRHENRAYLADIALPSSISFTSDLSAAVTAAQGGVLLAATSVAGLRPLAQALKGKAMKGQAIPNLVWLCKGFEEGSRLLPHQVVREELGSSLPAGALSGPSFAQEVAQGLPCALTVASADAELARLVVHAVHGRAIRVYASEDLIGVEVGGAVKNILAIATGIADGMGLGMNARAALITRGLVEISRLGVALGAKPETFTGLTGMGDLILTCTGALSRNRRVGLGLAQGKPLSEVVAELGHVAEGVRCAQAVCTLARERGIDMPIAEAVASILFNARSPRETVAQLLARDPRSEN
jgi:glycerol-3-phosphate dehydrogenase (NAD(P)+)